MKKFTITLLAMCIAIFSFGQILSGKKGHNPEFTSKAPVFTASHGLNQPAGKVIWTASSQAKVNYLTENFDGTWLPASWTQVTTLTAKSWQQGNPSGSPFSTIDPTNVSSAICPYSLPGEVQNEWVKSPSITGTSAAAVLTLKFWAGFSYDYLPAGGQGNPGATLQCKISTDGGSNWTLLWDANNTPSFSGWVWREITIDLTSYKSAPFMLAWQVSGADGDLMGLDNIVVSEPSATDVSISKISAPVSSCSGLTSSEDVVVKINNYGSASATGFPVSYSINNGTPVTITYASTIAAGDSATYTFTGANAANLSADGNYLITAYTAASGDGDVSNDTAMTAVFSGADAVPVNMGFEASDIFLGWSVLDANADGSSWSVYNSASYAHSGTNFAAYDYSSANAADDWFFTKCISLSTGKDYRLQFYYRARSETYPEALNVNIGASNDAASMTTQLVDKPTISDTTYQLSSTIFTVSSTGNYYIGFHAKSDADMWSLLLDDISIEDVTGIAQNAVVSQFNVYPNPASDILNIESNFNITSVRIMNCFGQIVIDQALAVKKATINISGLSEGLYFVEVNGVNEKFTSKIAVK